MKQFEVSQAASLSGKGPKKIRFGCAAEPPSTTRSLWTQMEVPAGGLPPRAPGGGTPPVMLTFQGEEVPFPTGTIRICSPLGFFVITLGLSITFEAIAPLFVVVVSTW